MDLRKLEEESIHCGEVNVSLSSLSKTRYIQAKYYIPNCHSNCTINFTLLTISLLFMEFCNVSFLENFGAKIVSTNFEVNVYNEINVDATPVDAYCF